MWMGQVTCKNSRFSEARRGADAPERSRGVNLVYLSVYDASLGPVNYHQDKIGGLSVQGGVLQGEGDKIRSAQTSISIILYLPE